MDALFMQMYDVAVIGAGPAGSTAAWKLGLAGLDVLLLEKDEFAGQNSVCAGGISAKMAEELKLPRTVIEKKIKGLKFIGENGLVARKYADSYTVQRKVFDRFLSERASKKCDYKTSTLITAAEHKGEFWEVSSLKEKFNAKVVVFADGPASSVRKKLGFGFIPNSKNSYGSVIHEFEAEETGSDFEMVFDPKIVPIGYSWLFPKKRHVNIGMCMLISKEPMLFRDRMEKLKKKHFPEFAGKKPFLERGAIIPAQIADNIADPRGLVAIGDAGGFADSLTGEGIHFAALTGTIAAQSIARALTEGDVSKVAEFKKEIGNAGWPLLLRAEKAFLNTLGGNALVYNAFFTKIYSGSFYDGALKAAEAAFAAVKKIRGAAD